MIDADKLRDRVKTLQDEALNELNESYRDGSITGWEEHTNGCYRMALTKVLKIIDELENS